MTAKTVQPTKATATKATEPSKKATATKATEPSTLAASIRCTILKGAAVDTASANVFVEARSFAATFATGKAFNDAFNTVYNAALDSVKRSHPAITMPHQVAGMSSIRAYRSNLKQAIDLDIDDRNTLSWSALRAAVKAAKAPAVEAPAVEAPAVEAPAVEAPAVEAPVSLDEAMSALIAEHGLDAVRACVIEAVNADIRQAEARAAVA